MKFDPLIAYNVRSIFLQKSYTKCSGETTRKPFSPLILWHDFNDFMKKCLRQSFVCFDQFLIRFEFSVSDVIPANLQNIPPCFYLYIFINFMGKQR